MERPIISLKGGVVRDESRRFRTPIDFSINPNEQIAVMGLNGSGKTILIETVQGNIYLEQGHIDFDFGTSDDHVSEHIRHITFRDAYGSADGEYYYQQRWNASDRENAPLVREMFEKMTCSEEERQHLFHQLGIEAMLDKQIILLSSGELRKFQIAKMLVSAPRILIVESPFIGLDTEARQTLEELLTRVVRESNVQIILSRIHHPRIYGG